MNDEIKRLKLEHENGYKNAILEIIKNNTDVLVNEVHHLLILWITLSLNF